MLTKDSPNICYYNACSLIRKLAPLIDAHNPDVVCIVETWLSDDIPDLEIGFPA